MPSARHCRQSLLRQTEWWPRSVWWIYDIVVWDLGAWLFGWGLAIMVCLITCTATQQTISQTGTMGLNSQQEITILLPDCYLGTLEEGKLWTEIYSETEKPLVKMQELKEISLPIMMRNLNALINKRVVCSLVRIFLKTSHGKNSYVKPQPWLSLGNCKTVSDMPLHFMEFYFQAAKMNRERRL